MGYKLDTARKSAWQFVAKTSDPRLSMLIKFARAIGIDPKELLKNDESRSEKPMTSKKREAAERAAKASIIDGRIQMRYEELSGDLIKGEQLERVWALPLDHLTQLADRLDGADPKRERASIVVVKFVSEYEDTCREAEQAAFEASAPAASVDMTIR